MCRAMRPCYESIQAPSFLFHIHFLIKSSDFVHYTYLSVNAKNGSNWHKAVDVGWAVEGIKTDNIFTLGKENKMQTR